MSAVVEGLLLTPFQAAAVLIGLVWVMPRLIGKEAYAILKPGWLLRIGLVISAIVFGYFCCIKSQHISEFYDELVKYYRIESVAWTVGYKPSKVKIPSALPCPPF